MVDNLSTEIYKLSKRKKGGLIMENETAKSQAKGKKKLTTPDMAYVGIFAAIIAVCSWISIPLTIPVTLQTMAVCITAGLLGTKRGTLTVFVYILIGLVGVPVFSNFSAGVGQLMGPTGGYLIGFIFTALIVGAATELLGDKIWVYVVSMIVGIAVLYAFGTAWFVIVYNRGNADAVTVSGALSMCVVPFIIPDLIKVSLAAFFCRALKKHIK